MQIYPLTVTNNPFYRCLSKLTMLTDTFDTGSCAKKLVPRELTLGLDDVVYFNLLLDYGQTPTSTTDLFEFFKNEDIDYLRNNKKAILFFDCTFEGYPEWDLVIAQSLEFSCTKYQINPKKIFLFTGNLKENNYNTLINIIPVFLLHLSFQAYGVNSINLDYAKEMCNQNFSKFILSLSRRPRSHRVFAHFMLSKSEIFDDAIISQDRIGSNFDWISSDILNKMESTQEEFLNFSRNLPFLADGDNFNINKPFSILKKLHSSTLFSIVNETHADNFNNKSLFFSEKTLKPIINFQPMIIYGQAGINRKMSDLGFKTYESYFNLDFDDESDDIYRYRKLLKNVIDVVKYLRSLNRSQQIEWRFKNQELLEFNYKNLLSMDITKLQLEKFLTLVRQVIYS